MWLPALYRPEVVFQAPRINTHTRVNLYAGKVLASIFCDQDCIFLIDYLPKGQTINAEYYSSLLMQLKDIFEGKTTREYHKGDLVLARQCPGSPDTCNPGENGLPGLPVS